VTPENAWIYAILPFVTMAVLTVGFIVVFRQRSKTRHAFRTDRGPSSEPPRPWWLRPWAWLVVIAVAVVLAVFVSPWLMAVALIVVPFAWRARPRRRPTVEPRTNGHAHRDGGAFTAE
jgi:ABC-type Fe3+ transport system permease subunit